mmetsp:Transcript_36578/g.96544  ORF Transcript_36578/g.96544 Transcript_36578/m.96544 type:complete len:554 (+) Transcript_36578:148-1809(+)
MSAGGLRMTLTHTVVDRTLCPSLSGNVHFDLSMANRNALRGLIEDDEICRTYVNVYGLVATAFDKRSGSFASPWSASARARFSKLCAAAFDGRGEACTHALAAAATCGPHIECTNARKFMTQLVGADNPAAWGSTFDSNPSTTNSVTHLLPYSDDRNTTKDSMPSQRHLMSHLVPSSRDASVLHELHEQTGRIGAEAAPKATQTAPLSTPSKTNSNNIRGEGTPPPEPTRPATSAKPASEIGSAAAQASTNMAANMQVSLPKGSHTSGVTAADDGSAAGGEPRSGTSATLPENSKVRAQAEREAADESVEACAVHVDDAIAFSTKTMEDFLLMKRRSSPTAAKSLRMLYSALSKCSNARAIGKSASQLPERAIQAKLWYRFGFLMRRTAKLPHAATLAFEHAISLNIETAGPPYVELTHMKLEALSVETFHGAVDGLMREIKTLHQEAMRLNSRLASHMLRMAYGDKSMLEILQDINERRDARLSQLASENNGMTFDRVQPSGIERCVVTRALRDVHELRGDTEKAAALDKRLQDELPLGQTLPTAPYASRFV